MASPGYYRFPTLHDQQVVFVSEDDLWTVPTGGGLARRLTSGLGSANSPALSPDGQWLAFSGRDEGPTEVYLMPAQGGPPQRLTFLGGNLLLVGWSPEGRILFAANARQPFANIFRLYALSPQAGESPELLPTGPALSLSYGPQGGRVIGRNALDPARWKRYRGGTTGDLWIDPESSGDWRRLLKLPGNLSRPMWIGKRIFFLSDHEGIGNLYSCLPSGRSLKRHTDHDEFYVRYPASDGRRIVYHAGADLYLYDPASEKSAPIEIEYRSPRTQRQRKFVQPAKYFEEYDLHPQGHLLALTMRGKAFTLGNWEGPVVQHGQPDGVRARLARWLSDGKRLVVVSDAQGEEQLEIHQAEGPKAPQCLKLALDIGSPTELRVSPLADQLALTNHRNELILVDLKAKKARLLDKSPYAPIAGFDWSPDGRWLAYSCAQSRHTAVIKLCDTESDRLHTVTKPVLQDISPVFDPEGKYLYFLSYREFDPVYDSLQFDLGFPRGARPYLVTLQKELRSPFVPVPEPPNEKAQENQKTVSDDPKPQQEEKPAPVVIDLEGIEDRLLAFPVSDGRYQQIAAIKGKLLYSELPIEGSLKHNWFQMSEPPDKATLKAYDFLEPPNEKAQENQKTVSDDPKPQQEEKPAPVVIDLEGIEDRLLAFPVSDGRYQQIAAIKGKLLYSELPIEGSLKHNWFQMSEPPAKATLKAYDFESKKEETLISGLTSFKLSGDHRTLVYRAGNRLRVLKAGEKPDEKLAKEPAGHKSGWIDLSRVKISVVPPAEWRQMYREAWQLQRDHFWTPDMSQVDWPAIYQRYLPLLERVSSRAEFSDLLWEMQGELGTSHAYELGGDYRPEPHYDLGFLGADLAYDRKIKAWRIVRIIRGDPWDDEKSSPLGRPGLGVREGDTLLAIGGRLLDEKLSPAELLVDQAGAEILLTVGDKRGKGPRDLAVKTLSGETPARYRDWVEQNRRYVHEQTGGRVGYLHIPDMGPRGYSEFHRYFLAETDREGLIVDVRFNGGGHVSELILGKLARRRIAYTQTRWFGTEPYPQDSVAGPLVALTNEYAGSDGDIFSHSFKLLKLGPLLGMRTWGGVIGIWPRQRLVDGGITTQPEFSFWFKDVGWGVENYGTDPDITVEMRPQDYVAGRDPQLERTVAEAAKLLEAPPPTRPDLSRRPSRQQPQLPER